LKTKAAVLRGAKQDWQVEEAELGDPVAGEVQVRADAGARGRPQVADAWVIGAVGDHPRDASFTSDSYPSKEQIR